MVHSALADHPIKEMEEELKAFGDIDDDEPVTGQEEEFLKMIPEHKWSQEEIERLNAPTTEQEVHNILKFETNLDSAPGEDGMTSRSLLKFWKFPSFRWIYIKYLNYTRFSDRYDPSRNRGVMVVLNKKSQSIEYEKKRKLTKVNKDSNVGNGKAWVNRMKKIILLFTHLHKQATLAKESMNERYLDPYYKATVNVP